ncbi:MAG: rod shape-determining protein MreD [Candidatus Aminicenantes bacterium]
MRNVVQILLAVILALFLFTVLQRISVFFIQLFNFFSLVVLYFALTKNEIYGACMGTVCGLLQDAFSLGVFGVSGISKTIMGFLAGYISKKINVIPYFRNLVFMFIMLCLEFALWSFLYTFIYSEKLLIGKNLFTLQPAATAILGSLLFLFLPKTGISPESQI